MAAYLPKFLPGQAVTLAASKKVVGGRLVEVTGSGTVGPAGPDSEKVVGVAGFDVEVGEPVTVYRGGVQRLVAAGQVEAGAQVSAGTDGVVSSGGTHAVGIALTEAKKEGDVIDVAL